MTAFLSQTDPLAAWLTAAMLLPALWLLTAYRSRVATVWRAVRRTPPPPPPPGPKVPSLY
ncbi:MAG: hypothetical protein K2M97_02540 [Muribaculaceae bacterium]|nr:hypothetical protein [Muribaculaceae bacterium]